MTRILIALRDGHRLTQLAIVEWPTVPRVGEKVCLQESLGSPSMLSYYVESVDYQQEVRDMGSALMLTWVPTGGLVVNLVVTREKPGAV